MSNQNRKRRVRQVGAAVLAPLLTGAWAWGADGSTTGGAQVTTDHLNYIGRMETATVSPCDTLISADNTQPESRERYAYTFLHGPGSRRGNTAYQWGLDQADSGYNCWLNSELYGYDSFGITIFGDAEQGSSWATTSSDHSANSPWQANVNVLSGYIAEMTSLLSYYGNQPGVYSALSFQSSYISGQTWAGFDFVWWAYGNCPAAGSNTTATSRSGLLSSSTYASRMVSWHSQNESKACLFGGQGVSMWQYNTSNTLDLDLSPQESLYTYDNEFGLFKPGWGDGTI